MGSGKAEQRHMQTESVTGRLRQWERSGRSTQGKAVGAQRKVDERRRFRTKSQRHGRHELEEHVARPGKRPASGEVPPERSGHGEAAGPAEEGDGS